MVLRTDGEACYKAVSATCYEGTPVQEKAVAFPTDVKLIHRARETLVRLARERLARERGVPLRAISPSPLWVCAVIRRRFPVGASPTRRTLQPEATGAVREVVEVAI